MAASPPATVEIVPWTEGADRARLEAEIDAIFFEASTIREFESDAARAAFRERWLGRYLIRYPQHAFVALAPDGTAAGYLVGSLSDPASDPLFADIPYVAGFATLSARYPAELHVNLAPQWRSHGIGARLVHAFVGHARQAGAPGIHVVTARGMRNVTFYERTGFREAGSISVAGREVLFLALPLHSE